MLPPNWEYDDCFNRLPEPFETRENNLYSQIAEIYESENMPREQKNVEVAQLRDEIRAVKVEAMNSVGGFEEFRKYQLKVKKDKRVRRRNKELVKKSEDIGINPSVAKKSPNLNVITQTLTTRGQVEELCSQPVGAFTEPLEKKLDQVFKEFVEASSQLDATNTNETLTAEIERVTQMFDQKKQELSSSKEALAAFYGRKQKKSARRHRVSDLESVEVSCKAHCSCKSVDVALGPVIHFERGVPSLGLGFDIDFNTKRENGVAISVSANQGRCEVGIESDFSTSGLEYSCAAKIHGFSNLSAGIRVPSKSFKQMLHPTNLVNNGQLFFGGRLKRGPLAGNVRFGVLPVEKFKDVFSYGINENRLESSSIHFEESNKVDLYSEEADQDLELVFKQEEVETTFSIAEVKEEAAEHQEDLQHESIESSVEGNCIKQAYMVASPVPAHFIPPNRGLDFPQYAIGALLFSWFVIYIFELFDKFKNRNKDL